MSEREPHPLVALLKARAESHPEEFALPIGRWIQAINSAQEVAHPEDSEALNDIVNKSTMDCVYANVMERILLPEKEQPDPDVYAAQVGAAKSYSSYPSGTYLGGAGSLASTHLGNYNAAQVQTQADALSQMQAYQVLQEYRETKTQTKAANLKNVFEKIKGTF